MRSIQSTLITLLTASSAAYAETTLNLTPGVTPTSHDVYQLHMTLFWICVAIGVAVFSVMFYALFKHRKSKGAIPAQFHHHPILEITWTIIPFIILVLMAIPSTKVLFNMNNNEKEDITIKVTGYQWKWHYEYLEDGLSFFSNLSTPLSQINNQAPKGKDYLREVDNPLVVPIHKKIRFLITSNDVNHAWWVPAFAVKRDALAGFINEAWAKIDKPGIYHGQCAELCGVNHAFMPIVVVALTEQGYKDWVAKQKGQATAGEAETLRAWTLEELSTEGEKVYSHICAACHQPGGTGLPPTFPALKGSKVTTGPIETHMDKVMNGVSGTAMQAFKNQMSDVEIAAVITYERNAWGNNTGTMVQPIQIKAYRDGKSLQDALATQPGAAAAPASTKAPAASSPPATSAPAPGQAAAQPAATINKAANAGQNELMAMDTTKGGNVSTPEAAQTTSAKPTGAANADDLKAAMARGEKVYLSTCVACHQPAGTGMPPTFPALKNSVIAKGPVAGHIDRVLNGKQGTAMMPFKEQLNDQDLADVITYERNAWGNSTGDLVSPQDIHHAREQDEKQ